MLKDKKNIIILVLSIIMFFLVIVLIMILINNKKSINLKNLTEKKLATNKVFNAGDELTTDELKTYFEKIFDTHSLVGITLLTNFGEDNYPYITSANISKDNEEIIVYYYPTLQNSKFNFSATYNKTNSELVTLMLYAKNINNESQSKIITSLASSNLIIRDTLDMTISNGIYASLKDNSKDFKSVYNKYGDIEWIVKKDIITSDDGDNIIAFYLTKKGIK